MNTYNQNTEEDFALMDLSRRIEAAKAVHLAKLQYQ